MPSPTHSARTSSAPHCGPTTSAPSRTWSPGRVSSTATSWSNCPAATPGPWSPYAVRLDGGDPGDLAPIRDGRAAVQDEGSQLCAIALATAPLGGPDEQWLDLCAGPGGKAALLAALAVERGARLTANELHPHRAELVGKATARWDVDIQVGDARQLSGQYDRVLLDAPCSGLGALRRRPEARWRRRPEDIAPLAELQSQLLQAALGLVRPGGVVGYVTCSPHLGETRGVVAGPDTRGRAPVVRAAARTRRRADGPALAPPAGHRRDVLRADPSSCGELDCCGDEIGYTGADDRAQHPLG